MRMRRHTASHAHGLACTRAHAGSRALRLLAQRARDGHAMAPCQTLYESLQFYSFSGSVSLITHGTRRTRDGPVLGCRRATSRARVARMRCIRAHARACMGCTNAYELRFGCMHTHAMRIVRFARMECLSRSSGRREGAAVRSARQTNDIWEARMRCVCVCARAGFMCAPRGTTARAGDKRQDRGGTYLEA